MCALSGTNSVASDLARDGRPEPSVLIARPAIVGGIVVERPSRRAPRRERRRERWVRRRSFWGGVSGRGRVECSLFIRGVFGWGEEVEEEEEDERRLDGVVKNRDKAGRITSRRRILIPPRTERRYPASASDQRKRWLKYCTKNWPVASSSGATERKERIMMRKEGERRRRIECVSCVVECAMWVLMLAKRGVVVSESAFGRKSLFWVMERVSGMSAASARAETLMAKAIMSGSHGEVRCMRKEEAMGPREEPVREPKERVKNADALVVDQVRASENGRGRSVGEGDLPVCIGDYIRDDGVQSRHQGTVPPSDDLQRRCEHDSVEWYLALETEDDDGPSEGENQPDRGEEDDELASDPVKLSVYAI